MVRTAFDTTLILVESWIQPAKPHRGAIANCVPISLTLIAAGEGNRFRVHVSATENLVYRLDAKDVFAVNRWTHVATTNDVAVIRMYVNGQSQEFGVSVYEGGSDQVIPNQELPKPFAIADLWPRSRLLIGNIRESDSGVQFHFSGRIGELRLNRSVYYHEEFQPEANLTVVPDTALLFHLRDGVAQQLDETGNHIAYNIRDCGPR